MNGRVYDTITSRFTSADPYIQAPNNSQSYNRYSYVMGNPVNFTDPSGYLLSGWSIKHIGSMGRDKIDHVKHWGQDHRGEIYLVVGALVTVYVEPHIGIGLMKYGVDTINKEETRTLSFQGSISLDFSGDVGVSSSNAVNYQSQAIVDEAAYSADRTDNSKYKNGGVSESFSSVADSKGEVQINSGEDGGTVITIIKYITPESEVINISDYAYEAFTYTNVGGAFDVGYQYYNGEISGYEAAGTGLGMLVVGGAGVKGLKHFSSFAEARGLYSQWGKGTFDTVKDNILHHSNKRGNGDFVTYMRQASNFNKRGAHKSNLSDTGTYTYTRSSGEFLIERNNKIVTYGWNRR